MLATRFVIVFGTLGLAGCVERADVLTRGSAGTNTKNSLLTVDVTCADTHSGALIAGVGYFWGSNAEGQLGSENTDNQLVPVRLEESKAWIQLASGASHSCGLDDSGNIYCWGGNARGQLGQGDRVSRSAPTWVPLPDRANQISAKFDHNCAILANTGLYCWGQNDEGQLGQADQSPVGDGTAVDGLTPVPITGMSWRFVAVGQGHTCAIATDGSLWCWGRNSAHQLGEDSRIQVRQPLQVTANGTWLNVSTGQDCTCAIMHDSTLWCWGGNSGADSNSGFPLGIAGAMLIASPTRVGTAANWALVQTNTFHSCAINQSAELWCWGRNAEGQLGTSDIINRSTPAHVASTITRVSLGRFTTCAVDEAGAVSCTGINDDGQLGTGDTARRNVLTPVSVLIANP